VKWKPGKRKHERKSGSSWTGVPEGRVERSFEKKVDETAERRRLDTPLGVERFRERRPGSCEYRGRCGMDRSVTGMMKKNR
jgi:hypothetical protein